MTKVVNQSLLLGSICVAAMAAAGVAGAQEVKNGSSSMAATAAITSVSQQQLNNAAKDGANFLHTNGNYDQTRFYERADQSRQRRLLFCSLDSRCRAHVVTRLATFTRSTQTAEFVTASSA